MPLPSLDRVRAGAHQARDNAGRVGTVGGAAVLAASLAGSQPLTLALPAAALAAGSGYMMSMAPAADAPGWLKAMYLAPVTALAVEAVAFQVASGFHWWEVLAAAGWTAAVWWLRPSLQARDWAAPDEAADETALLYGQLAVVDEAAAPAIDMNAPIPERLAAYWSAHVGNADGPAPGTHLERIAATGPRDWAAHIVADVAGQPVPSISVPRLSALMDIPEELFTLGPVPGSGAGRRRIRVAESVGGAEDFAGLWAGSIAPAAMPGTTVIAVRKGEITKEIHGAN